MSQEYAEKKIREALALHNGNTARARKLLLSLAQEDSELLRALSRPHLDGIIAYQVERVSSGKAEIEKRHPKEAVKKEDENFGMNLLRAVAKNESVIFGQQNPMGRGKKTASKQHIDAIHKIISSRKDDRR